MTQNNHVIGSGSAHKINGHIIWLVGQCTNLAELYDRYYNLYSDCQMLEYLLQVIEENAYYYQSVIDSEEYKRAKQRHANSCTL